VHEACIQAHLFEADRIEVEVASSRIAQSQNDHSSEKTGGQLDMLLSCHFVYPANALEWVLGNRQPQELQSW